MRFPDWAEGHSECELLRTLRETPAVWPAIATAHGSELQIQKQLRARFDDQLVRAALTLAELRRKAATKFPRAVELWFDRQGLEQATSHAVAEHKARRFTAETWDLCCGIGSDACALAARVDVTAVDLEPSTALRAWWNAEVLGVDARLNVLCADVLQLELAGRLVHIDPDRRPGLQGRAMRIEDYVPGLEWLQTLTRQARGGAIKLGPASNFGGKFPGTEVELISLNGECKEATIWFGELAGPAPFRATALPSGETLAGHPLDALAPRSTMQRYLYDPDPAIVRAGLVDLLAERLGLARLDDAEEYLTGDRLATSPFVQAFEVLEVLPNQERELRAALRRSDFGTLEIKCRHLPIAAEELRRRLPLPGHAPGVVLFVREQGRAKSVLARRTVLTSGQ